MGREKEEMTLGEFGVFNKAEKEDQDKDNVFPDKGTPSSRRGPLPPKEDPRAPSPDISSILSATPHLILSKSLNYSSKFSGKSSSSDLFS